MQLRKIISNIVRRQLNESSNLSKRKARLFTENEFNGKTIMNVDIQPEYQDYITFDIYQWAEFINQSYASNDIVFLYNGYETLGMVSEDDYKMWLYELGIEEDIVYNATFMDKGYAFFRFCMDNAIEEDNIVDLVKFMIRHNINDSRDIDEEMWNQYMEETGHSQQEVRDLMENADDVMHIPELMEFLGGYSNIVLLGGGINECLKEVEIALLSLDKQYNLFSKFTY